MTMSKGYVGILAVLAMVSGARAAELEVLRDAWARAVGGDGCCVLVEGEAA